MISFLNTSAPKLYIQENVREYVLKEINQNPPELDEEENNKITQEQIFSILHKQYVDIFIKEKAPSTNTQVETIILEIHLKYLIDNNIIQAENVDS